MSERSPSESTKPAGRATLGPWRLSDDPVRRVIRGGGERERTVCIIEDWTTEADARLIAAAPELADALLAWVESTDASEQTGSMRPVYDAARAALRAAGRSTARNPKGDL